MRATTLAIASAAASNSDSMVNRPIPRVVEAMLPFFVEHYGNPSSASHVAGRRASDAVENARGLVAELIVARPGEVVFTSGATESNNLAIQGLARGGACERRRILVSAIEHKAVLEPAHSLIPAGFDVQEIPVLDDGLVDIAALVGLADEQTALVSVQAASNEIGTIQPIAEISQIAHRVGAVMHCDAAQAPGRILVDVGEWDVDLLSISAHKCYGPKGVGALYVRGGAQEAPLAPLFFGGGQERGLRSGTVNVPGVVGMGKAAAIVLSEGEGEATRIAALRDRFEEQMLARVHGTRRNGAISRRLCGNSSLAFEGVDAEAIITNLPHIALSTGSACTSGAPEPSHVLTAIGMRRTEAYSTLRIGIGRFTMESELEAAADAIASVVARIREISLEAAI